MEKKTIFTLIIISLFSTSQAQTKMNVSPAYDNIHIEHSIKQHNNPILYILQQKGDNAHNQAALSGNEYKINLNSHTITPYQQKNYLKKVSFK